MKGLDFQGLNQRLLSDIRQLLPQWLPGGKLEGNEYVCGDLTGRPGQSCKVNLSTAKWADFAAGQQGGDLISLFAAINGCDQKRAYETLAASYNYNNTGHDQGQPKLIPPPKGTSLPDQLKNASQVWRYKSLNGTTLFMVSRRDLPDGKKSFCPWSWSSDGKWVKKIWPQPRPLYGLEHLNQDPKKPILIVEGEKAADAARKIQSPYLVVTWPSGSKAFTRADWKPIYGRSILIWPDADEPGIHAAQEICKILHNHCPEIKVLNVNDQPKGFDAADALADGMDQAAFIKWAKPRAFQIKPPKQDEDAGPQSTPPDMKSMVADVVGDMMPYEATASMVATWSRLGLTMNATATNPLQNLDNVMIAMERHKPLNDIVWYDEFHMKYYTRWRTGKLREWSETDDLSLMRYMQNTIYLSRITKQTVQDAVILYANERTQNEPRDWMKSLEWDGTFRVEQFFPKYMGTVDTDYTRAVSRNFWVSMAARIFKPGCKFDNMVILEGRQGAYKSSALSVIGGDWFTEMNEHPSSKDFYQILQGSLVVEIAELDAFNKAETETIKRVVSTPSDRFRPPYGKAPQNFPRQCIFVGTTNEKNYLRDFTGARRFWPISITEIDLSGITRDREQLFAEAVHLFKKGHTWHEVPKSAEDEQEKRREADVWEDAIQSYIDGRKQATIAQIATSDQGIGMDLDRVDRRVQLRISKILRLLQWESKGAQRIMGKVQKVWGPVDTQESFDLTESSPESASSDDTRAVYNYAPSADNPPPHL